MPISIRFFRTPVNNRTTTEQGTASVHSQITTPRIVVSVDRRRLDLNNNFNNAQRTSTPIRPPRREQVPMENLPDERFNSFSVDEIPKETYEILSRFPEFRRLVKALNNERRKNVNWAKDFGRLQRKYKQLEENSFRKTRFCCLTNTNFHISSSSTCCCTQLSSRFSKSNSKHCWT